MLAKHALHIGDGPAWRLLTEDVQAADKPGDRCLGGDVIRQTHHQNIEGLLEQLLVGLEASQALGE